MSIPRIFCFAVLSIDLSLVPVFETRKVLKDSNRRLRRDTDNRAQIRGNDGCSDCGAAGSHTSLFSGECFMCPTGVPGPRGPPGQQGIPGRNGRDGRDAPVTDKLTETEPAPAAAPRDPPGRGAVYIRWGRDVCPSSSVLVYSGSAGGAYYSHKGSGSNYLCLPEEPIYDDPVAGNSGQIRGLVYGAEYQTSSFSQWNHLNDNDAPCAVCMASSRPTLVMIPARNICPDGGWTKEYSGYLVSAYYNHEGRTEFVCMDRDPQVISRSAYNSNGALFYPVEGRCGSSGSGLPCGPYVDSYELTCAVCTM